MIPILVHLSKLTDLVRKNVVKKAEYDEFVKKCNATQTNDTTNLVKKADYNKKLAILKKITYYARGKNITTQEFNKLAANNFAARLKIANLTNKNDITNFVRKKKFDEEQKNYNKKITSNKTKRVLFENELDELSEERKLISTKGLIDSDNILTVENIFVEIDHKTI